MQPARQTSRNLLVICGAAVSGIIIGGVSVLGVAIAVIEPPSRDAPAGSAVFDGQPHVVQQTPTSATPQTAAASQAGTPVEAQAMPPTQQTPEQVLDKTWPDAPPARPPHAPESAAGVPAPKPPASNVAGNVQTATPRSVTPHNYSQTPVAPNPDTTKRRVVVTPNDAQQPREDDTDVASTGSSSRPLFDFFGTLGDERQRDDRNVVSVPPPPQPRASRNPRDPQLVIRHRQDSDGDNQEAVNSGPPPQYDSWDNFFGYSRNDNWHN